MSFVFLNCYSKIRDNQRLCSTLETSPRKVRKIKSFCAWTHIYASPQYDPQYKEIRCLDLEVNTVLPGPTTWKNDSFPPPSPCFFNSLTLRKAFFFNNYNKENIFLIKSKFSFDYVSYRIRFVYLFLYLLAKTLTVSVLY